MNILLDKNICIGEETNEYKYGGYWEGMYHYRKRDGNGNLWVHVSKKDIISGNAAHMMRHDLSREQFEKEIRKRKTRETIERYDVDPIGKIPGEIFEGSIEAVKARLEKRDECKYVMTEASPIRAKNVAPDGCITAYYHFAINNAPGGRAFFFWKSATGGLK